MSPADSPVAKAKVTVVLTSMNFALRLINFVVNDDFCIKNGDLIANIKAAALKEQLVATTAPPDNGSTSQGAMQCELQYKCQLVWEFSIENAEIMQICP